MTPHLQTLDWGNLPSNKRYRLRKSAQQQKQLLGKSAQQQETIKAKSNHIGHQVEKILNREKYFLFLLSLAVVKYNAKKQTKKKKNTSLFKHDKDRHFY